MIAENTVEFFYDSADKVELDFYQAFEQGDIELMKRVFADDNVSYAHPASPVIFGKQAVIDYWEFLLTGINKTAIHRKTINKFNLDNIEVHLVSEVTELDALTKKQSETITTNVYIKQHDGWRLQMQHSSPSGDIVDTSTVKEFEKMMGKVISPDME